MDIERPDRLKKKKRNSRIVTFGGGALFVAVVLSLFFYDPGPFRVERNLVYTGEVKHGEMLRQVRGAGTLVPAEVRWIAAQTSGRIERILILPGALVEPDSVVMELSNPELIQQMNNALLQLNSDEANYLRTKVDLQGDLLQIKSTLAQRDASYKQAVITAKMDKQLYDQGLESELQMRRSELNAEQLESQLELEKQRLVFREEAMESQLAAERSRIEQTRARYQLLKSQVEALTIRAGFAGVLQRQDVEVGQQVQPGRNLSQVADPNSLKAEIKISEHQAKDVAIGLSADIDTRNGIIKGRVMRVDPNVDQGTVAVDIELISEYPPGMRPDLTVEGVIEIEKIVDTLYADRPIYAPANKSVAIFRFIENSNIAERTTVTFGRASVNTIEVLDGLNIGDRIILSDTSDWDTHDQIELY